MTTHGGTSDARFIHKYCPVIEFGLTNKTIHMVDEFCTVENLKNAADHLSGRPAAFLQITA